MNHFHWIFLGAPNIKADPNVDPRAFQNLQTMISSMNHAFKKMFSKWISYPFNGMEVGMGGAKALAHSAWHVPWLPERQTAFIQSQRMKLELKPLGSFVFL